VNGIELWRSDGTEAGTVIVKNIGAGAASSSPRFLTQSNGLLYFEATTGTTGFEPWRSDGTDAGTFMISDINPGTGQSSSNGSFIYYNGFTYFSAYAPLYGVELWKTDGTVAGTSLASDIIPGPTGSNLYDMLVYNNNIYFSAQDAGGILMLYKSDGTSAGTEIFSSTLYDPVSMKVINGMLYLAAFSDGRGVELWKTDGTPAGTVLVKEFAAGTASSYPSLLTQVDNRIFLRAGTTAGQQQLWVSEELILVPLSLLEFNGILENNDGLLYWKTEHELNTHSFIIERSADGINYRSIGSVAAMNTSGRHSYHFNDRNIGKSGLSTIYYRLKQTDLDGRFSYSPIVILSVKQAGINISVYPNPVADVMNVSVNTPKAVEVKATLVNVNGQAVKQFIWNFEAGSNNRPVNIGNLPAGVYYLHVNGNGVNDVINVMKR
jgi:ELWxxDGT repeat protein